MPNIRKFSSIVPLITIFTVSTPIEVRSEDTLVQNDFYSALTCHIDWDRNKGHGNDPYIEFAMNLDSIGQVDLSGDFDLDNPGTSLDTQLSIVADNETVLWTALNDEQKQQIKAELGKQICLVAGIFPD